MKYLANVATLQYAPDKCTGCGRCVEVCPQGVFVLRQKLAAVTDKDLCMECGACAMNCEFGAISVNSGVGCAAALINSMVTGRPPSCGCDSTAAGCCG
ncbi:MAG: mercury methylation ferredoxin HgcB [Nitrospirota bacterium]